MCRTTRERLANKSPLESKETSSLQAGLFVGIDGSGSAKPFIPVTLPSRGGHGGVKAVSNSLEKEPTSYIYRNKLIYYSKIGSSKRYARKG